MLLVTLVICKLYQVFEYDDDGYRGPDDRALTMINWSLTIIIDVAGAGQSFHEEDSNQL